MADSVRGKRLDLINRDRCPFFRNWKRLTALENIEERSFEGDFEGHSIVNLKKNMYKTHYSTIPPCMNVCSVL